MDIRIGVTLGSWWIEKLGLHIGLQRSSPDAGLANCKEQGAVMIPGIRRLMMSTVRT
jgi:hypothetical protein